MVYENLHKLYIHAPLLLAFKKKFFNNCLQVFHQNRKINVKIYYYINSYKVCVINNKEKIIFICFFLILLLHKRVCISFRFITKVLLSIFHFKYFSVNTYTTQHTDDLLSSSGIRDRKYFISLILFPVYPILAQNENVHALFQIFTSHWSNITKNIENIKHSCKYEWKLWISQQQKKKVLELSRKVQSTNPVLRYKTKMFFVNIIISKEVRDDRNN